ncbi:MAG: hypothetical protein LBH48_03305 [Bifidobacteriaceae bacterium]|nr:hypothetical protein [Bifidobacteriaceae bacterium]
MAAALGVSLVAAPQGAPASADDPLDPCSSQVNYRLPGSNTHRLAATPGTITGLAYSNAESRTVALEVSSSGTWTTVSTAAVAPSPDGSRGWTLVDLAYPPDVAQGSQSMRVTMAPAGVCTQVTSAPFVMAFRKAQYTFNPTMEVTSSGPSMTASTRSNLTLVGSTRAETLGTLQVSDIVVQRSVAGGPWTALPGVGVKAMPTATSSSVFDLRADVPRLSGSTKQKAVSVAYRFASVETPTVATTFSKPLTVGYFNARAVVRAAVVRDCPTTKVYFKKKFPKDRTKAAGYYSWGRNKIVILSPAIDDRMPLEHVQSIAHHECGHRLQETAYKKHSAAVKAAQRVFGTNHSDPLEHWADCIAMVRQPKGYLGYGGKCTAKQLKAAKRTLRGKKL